MDDNLDALNRCIVMRERKLQVVKVVEYFDKFGFAVFKSQFSSEFLDERCHDYQKNISTNGTSSFSKSGISKHKKDWEHILKKWNYYYQNGAGTKVYSSIVKGVPRSVRPILWKKLLNMEALRSNSEFKYNDGVLQLRKQMIAFGITEYNTSQAEQDLVHMDTEEADDASFTPRSIGRSKPTYVQILRQILLDVARTYTTHKMYFGETADAIEGRAALFRILAVYNLYNPEVGYCQGMSFIAGMLLMILTEEDSFWCFVALLSRPKYLLKYFDYSLERVKCHAAVFDNLLKKRQHAVWQHLTENGLNPLIYVTQWFMCLFTSLPCWDSVLSIWDLLLFEGVTAIFRTALAVIESNSANLFFAEDANGLIPLLQRLPPSVIHSEILLPILWNTVVDKWELETIQDILNEGEISHNVKPQMRQPENASRKGTNSQDKPGKNTLASKMKSSAKPSYGKILNRIVNMFATNKSNSKPNTNIPDIVVTSPNSKKLHAKSSCNAENIAPRDRHNSNSDSQSLQSSAIQSPEYCRVRAQSTSAVSLGRVAGVAVSSATDHQAFCEFNSRAPLRRSQRSKSCLVRQDHSGRRSLSGSPVELHPLLGMKDGLVASADLSPVPMKTLNSFQQIASPSMTSFNISIDDAWISPTYSDDANIVSPVDKAFAF